MPPLPRLRNGVVLILQLALLGVLVGLACWPLNLVDHWQDQLLNRLPAFTAAGWSPLPIAQACSPLVVMPLLLALQARVWRRGAGSGIPQTMLSLEEPSRSPELLAADSTVQRLTLRSISSQALVPLGRDRPGGLGWVAVVTSLTNRAIAYTSNTDA